MGRLWNYDQGQEDPAYTVTWRDADDAIIDFSSGYTFQVRLVGTDGTTALSKTTNITGAATAPNISVAWATGELNLTAGVYEVHLRATSSSRDREFAPGDRDLIKIHTTAPAAS